jgi:hypothetical protein
MVFSKSYILSATHPTLIHFPSAVCDEVDFVTSGGLLHPGYEGGGEHFAMDNLSVAVAVKY